ncbi:hypothetical protein GQ457_01G006120 [Hibiscus cannabinus]
MALLQNILGCFTESSESKYICRGDVGVLRDQKKSVKKTTRISGSKAAGISYRSFLQKLHLATFSYGLFICRLLACLGLSCYFDS